MYSIQHYVIKFVSDLRHNPNTKSLTPTRQTENNLPTSMNSSVSFQVKGVVEPFSTERTQIPLGLAVTFKMTVKQSLNDKFFTTNFARKSSFSSVI